VLQKVGLMSYKLQLPQSSKIHPVIHVSQLKRALKPIDQLSIELPVSSANLMFGQPVTVTRERVIHRGNKMVPQVKVQWAGLPSHCQTWEHLGAIVSVFLSSPAWGQAVLQGGGNVTTRLLPEALKVKRRTDAIREGIF
jgi:hypothetical protein